MLSDNQILLLLSMKSRGISLYIYRDIDTREIKRIVPDDTSIKLTSESVEQLIKNKLIRKDDVMISNVYIEEYKITNKGINAV